MRSVSVLTVEFHRLGHVDLDGSEGRIDRGDDADEQDEDERLDGARDPEQRMMIGSITTLENVIFSLMITLKFKPSAKKYHVRNRLKAMPLAWSTPNSRW